MLVLFNTAAMMAVEHVKAVRIASMYPYLMVAVPCLPRGWEVIVSLLPACFRVNTYPVWKRLNATMNDA